VVLALSPRGCTLGWVLAVVGCAAPPSKTTSMSPKLFRVIVPVSNIDEAARFYEKVLAIPGQRVSSGRHYFSCEGTILACFDPRADGDDWDATPNPDHIYFAVDDLEAAFARCREAKCKRLDDKIEKRPWGERSFYATDPFGNKFCFVDRKTVFTGR
jgi:catechol 2,3-dioxygenase-like lactoylglutathione lyase family enzyme